MNRFVALLLILCVIAPLASALATLSRNYADLPAYGDGAVIELVVFEIAEHPPLVGQITRFNLRQPGPAQFYSLAPFYFLGGKRASALRAGAAIIHSLALLATAAVLWSLGGALLSTLGVISLLSALLVLGPELWINPLNPYLPLTTLGLYLSLTWVWMEQHSDWPLPWLAVTGTFCVQSHAVYAPVVVGCMSMALIRSLVLRRVEHSSSGQWLSRFSYPSVSTRLEPNRIAAAAVLAITWFPPLLETVLAPPGNLLRLGKHLLLSRQRHFSFADGIAFAGATLSWPSSFGTIDWSAARGPAAASLTLSLAVLTTIAGAIWLTMRRRRGLPTGIVLGVTLVAVSAISLIGAPGEYRPHYHAWVVIAGSFMYVTLVWSLAEILPTRWRASKILLSVALFTVIAASALLSKSATRFRPPETSEWERSLRMAAAVDVAADKTEPIFIYFERDQSGRAIATGLTMVTALTKAGYQVLTPQRAKWFNQRDRPPSTGSQVLMILGGEHFTDQLPGSSLPLDDDALQLRFVRRWPATAWAEVVPMLEALGKHSGGR